MAISYAQKASILMGHINGNLKKSRKRIETYFLSSPLAVKQDITVTIIFFGVFACMPYFKCACWHPDFPGHNFYIYAWISK